MLTVHHLENSRSQRVLWLLEEMGLEYAVVTHQREGKTRLAAPDLKKVHPLGKAPVLQDDSFILAETGAIVDYLLDKFPANNLMPTAPQDKARYFYWKNFSEGSFMTFLAMKLLMHNLVTKTPAPVRPISALLSSQVDKHYLGAALSDTKRMVEAHLAIYDWFAGDSFSAADILMTFALEAVSGPSTCDNQPAIAAFLDRIRQRPAYRSAQLRGNWSVEGHAAYWAFLH